MLLMNVRFNLTKEKFNQVDDDDIDSILDQVIDLLDTLRDQLPDGVELDKDQPLQHSTGSVLLIN